MDPRFDEFEFVDYLFLAIELLEQAEFIVFDAWFLEIILPRELLFYRVLYDQRLRLEAFLLLKKDFFIEFVFAAY